MSQPHTLRLILGDQLNIRHSWFQHVEADVMYVLAELRSETDYARHHIQKVVAFFSAMRAFAEELKAAGHHVHYIRLDEAQSQNFVDLFTQLVNETGCTHVAYQLPDEYRLDRHLKQLSTIEGITVEALDTEHFYTHRDELAELFKGKKQFLMERFYRHMRKKHGVLMDGSEPATGRWNYDEENRKKLPKNEALLPAKTFGRDVSDVVDMLEKAGVKTMGRIDAARFLWPITREEGLVLLDHFVKRLLPKFGAYQDAMTKRDWSLFHSRLSFVMNVKLLSPKEVVETIEAHWRMHPEHATIAQVEGFIRQILGWREYMRGIYWAKMPEYAELNYFDHTRKLPEWYWTGETKMSCLQHAIGQSLDYAYAHHIQRLMVTGNFALLAGIDPNEVDAWYLGVYIDAIEWVEITNTRGMSQFADGGIVGSKPYVSSANYMKKMGTYCGDCAYRHDVRVGEGACPFNSLYWHFYDRHRSKLEKNPRIGMMYRTWDKMEASKQQALLEQAEYYLERINEL